MSTLVVGCRKLRDENEFAYADNIVKSSKQLVKRYNGSMYHTWLDRFNYIKPGFDIDGTKALVINVRIMGGVSVDANLFGHVVGRFFGQEFQADNILSCAYKEGSAPSVETVVFPLNRRKLNADNWLNILNKEELNRDFLKKLEKAVHEQFGDLVLTGEETNIADFSSLGYEQKLIEFKPHASKKEDGSELIWDTKDVDSQIQTDLPYDQIKEITDRTLTYYTIGPERLLFERSQRQDTEVTPEKYMKHVKDYINRQYPKVKEHDMEIILNKIYRAVYQNYILEPLINEDAISDIKVLGPDKIRVKVGGERYTSNISFINGEDYERFIFELATRNGLNLKENAINVFSDTTTNDKFRMRFNITTPYINSSEYPYLHIRKIAKNKRGMDYLLNAGMLDRNMANYLIEHARYGKGIIFCGKGASGKTTLMNCLLDYIPFDMSGIVIQESDELFSDVHPDLMFQRVTQNVAVGEKIYDLQALARNGLLVDLDYYVIGEIKGAEAKYFMMAADTGHRCWCSVHSPSSLDAIDKLADYVTYDTNYTKNEAVEMLKELGVVVFMKNFKVCEISEISGYDRQKKQLLYTPVYKRPVA